MVEIFDISSDGTFVPVKETNKRGAQTLTDLLSEGYHRSNRNQKEMYKSIEFYGELYHGTNVENIRNLNVSSRDNSIGRGVYLTVNPDVAERFAQDRFAVEALSNGVYKGKPTVYQVRTKRKLKLLDLTDGSYLKDIIKGFVSYIKDKNVTLDNSDKRKAYQAMQLYRVFYDENRFVTAPFDKEFKEYIQSLGFDGIVHGNKNLRYAPFDYGIGSYTQVVIFDPNNIEIEKSYTVPL